MKKFLALVTIIVLLAFVAGCLPYVKEDFTSYSFNGKEVTLGMTANNVREIAGVPRKINLPDAVSKTVFPNGVYDNMTKGQQYWQYGSLKNGDKEEMSITFTDGIVTNIQKFKKK